MKIAVLSLFLFACAARPPAPKPSPPDSELFEACVADVAFVRACDLGEDGAWHTVRPPTNLLLQGRTTLESGHYQAAVVSLTRAMEEEDACGRQAAIALRAEALFHLRDYRASFLDFAAIVRAGPESPFYATVGEWLRLLEPHLPTGALVTCWASYDPGAASREETLR